MFFAKLLQIVGVVLAVYVTLSLLFGGLLGYFQPQYGGTVRLRTVNASGHARETVVRLLEDDGQLWMLSGQWFRGWYNRALQNSSVEVVRGDDVSTFRATEVTDPTTLARVIRLRRGTESAGVWWMGRALLLFAPFKALRLDAPESPDVSPEQDAPDRA